MCYLPAFGGIGDLPEGSVAPYFVVVFPNNIWLALVMETVHTWKILRQAAKNSNGLR